MFRKLIPVSHSTSIALKLKPELASAARAISFSPFKVPVTIGGLPVGTKQVEQEQKKELKNSSIFNSQIQKSAQDKNAEEAKEEKPSVVHNLKIK